MGQMIWHAGAVPGVSTLVAVFPQLRAGVVVLANADGKSQATLRIGGRIIKSILRQPLEEYFIPRRQTISALTPSLSGNRISRLPHTLIHRTLLLRRRRLWNNPSIVSRGPIVILGTPPLRYVPLRVPRHTATPSLPHSKPWTRRRTTLRWLHRSSRRRPLASFRATCASSLRLGPARSSTRTSRPCTLRDTAPTRHRLRPRRSGRDTPRRSLWWTTRVMC
jgi:hypothetical protein